MQRYAMSILLLACVDATSAQQVRHTIPFSLSVSQVSALDLQTCNGFVNQRLSVLYGLILAQKSNRSVYLPKLHLNGRQLVDQSFSLANLVPFSHFYDVEHFVATIQPHVRVLAQENNRHVPFKVTPANFSLLWTGIPSSEPVRVSCPLFHLPAETVKQHIPLVNAWLEAFRPAARFHDALAAGRAHLARGQYNYVHWRAEEDCMPVWFVRQCSECAGTRLVFALLHSLNRCMCMVHI